MFRTVEDFVNSVKWAADEGGQVLAALTDESLSVSCSPGHRTIGQVVWHCVQTIPDMAGEVGLTLDKSVLQQPVPSSAQELKDAYKRVTDELLSKAGELTEEVLLTEHNIYGETWKKGFTLFVMFSHEVHHFGQLTVLMRAAGLPVHGRFGPSQEEWAQHGIEQPKDLA
jgi:uncharacterized damage-inducible protein DinB